MKTFHPLSFLFGLVCGLVVLVIFTGGWRLVHPSTGTPRASGGFQQNGGGFSVSRMAQRLGMSETDLQKELDSGKTFQQIAQERGVALPTREQRQSGSGAILSASGTTVSSSASSISHP